MKNSSSKSNLPKPLPLLIGAAAVALGVAIPAGIAWVFLHPPRRLHPRNPKSALGIPYERVRFRAKDGITLRGWYVPPPSDVIPRGMVVISHGYFGNRAEMLPYLKFLHHGGYAALLYDFRAHGWSSGNFTTFGIHEPMDLQAALHWVEEREEVRDLPLILLGESMGASVSLLVAAQEKRIRAIVADSPYARFDSAVAGRLRTAFGNQVTQVILPSTQRIGERILGARAADIAPMHALVHIAPRPVFLIHGLADSFILPENSQHILAAAPGNAQLWEVPDARHVRSVYVAGEDYGKRVLGFLDTVLNGEGVRVVDGEG